MTKWVYFASFDPEFIKIGHSSWPADRVRSMKATNCLTPTRLVLGSGKVIGVAPWTALAERDFQGLFARYRVSGTKEWFHDCASFRYEIGQLGLAPVEADLPEECKRVSFTVRIEEELFWFVKSSAAEAGIPMYLWFERALRAALGKGARK